MDLSSPVDDSGILEDYYKIVGIVHLHDADRSYALDINDDDWPR
jgi:hypothetical protein